jgi:hypothetical protein
MTGPRTLRTCGADFDFFAGGVITACGRPEGHAGGHHPVPLALDRVPTRCPEHDIRRPCGHCRSEHLAGEHTIPDATCPDCQHHPTPVDDRQMRAAGERSEDS